jgi:hypothetical protein
LAVSAANWQADNLAGTLVRVWSIAIDKLAWPTAGNPIGGGSIGLMSDTNKRNLVYFENPSMHGLYASMEEWQQANDRRLLSISVQQDGGNYCCIALTNPTEIVITSADGKQHAGVAKDGRLRVRLF